MDAFKIIVKLFAESDPFKPDEFVPIFHRWVQQHAMAGHLMIDVADYAHVPEGPGTMIVCDEALLSTDRGGNRLGLMYTRKTPGGEAFADRLRQAVEATTHFAMKLEQEPELAGRLKFHTDELLIKFNDRALAPNNSETFASVKPELEKLSAELFAGQPAAVTYVSDSDAQALFAATIKAGPGTTLANLHDRVAPATV